MPQRMQLPDIPDPPPNHRLRAVTFLAAAGVLVASVASDSYGGSHAGKREHVFTHLGAAIRDAMRSVTGGEAPQPAAPQPAAPQRRA